MRGRGWSIAALVFLAACNGDTDPASRAEATGAPAVPVDIEVSGPERRVLAFGDSLFAGYGLVEHEGFPERLEVALRARGINARVIDAGVSGDTTAAGRQRIGFVLDSEAAPPDLVIVELGGNDLLRGIPPEQTRANLAAILEELRSRNLPVLIMGMRAPPNLGEAFVAEFDGLYPELARQYGAALVPFFMEAVYDRPALMQQDRVHPTAEGIQAMVDATVADVTKALPPPAD